MWCSRVLCTFCIKKGMDRLQRRKLPLICHGIEKCAVVSMPLTTFHEFNYEALLKVLLFSFFSFSFLTPLRGVCDFIHLCPRLASLMANLRTSWELRIEDNKTNQSNTNPNHRAISRTSCLRVMLENLVQERHSPTEHTLHPRGNGSMISFPYIVRRSQPRRSARLCRNAETRERERERVIEDIFD